VSLSTEALRARSLAMAKAVQLGLSDAAKAPPAPLHAGASAAAALAIASIQRNLSAAGGNIASAMAAGATGTLVVSADGHAVDELDINEYPQQARFITIKESVRRVEEWSGASVTSRGVYVPPGRMPAPGERRLHLIISGPSEVAVKKAKAELRRVLEEETLRVGANAVISQMAAGGKYTV
jgi:ATP-dependent RNA helicase DDX46/PRP5